MAVVVVFWILFAVFSGVIASAKNRNAVGWALIGLIFGPFGLLVAAMPAIPQAAAQGASPGAGLNVCPHCGAKVKPSASFCGSCFERFEPAPAAAPTEKVCPYCAETIKAAATVCRFCNRDLNGSASTTLAPPEPPR